MSNSAATFQRLPQTLVNFFTKYPPRPFVEYLAVPSTTTDPAANPFLPNKHTTGVYHAPAYLRRRQADLYKTARKFGLEEMLPPMAKKLGAEKMAASPMMRGVWVEKLKKHQRTREERYEKRAAALDTVDEKMAEVRGSKHWERKHKRAAKQAREW